jgi:hypothetical protein
MAAAGICPHVGKRYLLARAFLQKQPAVGGTENEGGEGTVEERARWKDVGHKVACERELARIRQRKTEGAVKIIGEACWYTQVFLLSSPIGLSSLSVTISRSSMSLSCSASYLDRKEKKRKEEVVFSVRGDGEKENVSYTLGFRYGSTAIGRASHCTAIGPVGDAH